MERKTLGVENSFNDPDVKDFDYFVKNEVKYSYFILLKGKIKSIYIDHTNFMKTCCEVETEEGQSVYCSPANANSLLGLEEDWNVEFIGTASYVHGEYQMMVNDWSCDAYYQRYGY